MASVLSIIAEQTKGKSYKTTKYAYEGIDVPRFDYVITNTISSGSIMEKMHM